jgi:hypothetical protein
VQAITFVRSMQAINRLDRSAMYGSWRWFVREPVSCLSGKWEIYAMKTTLPYGYDSWELAFKYATRRICQ